MDPPGGSVLEVQAVHWLLVMPGDLTSDDFHPPESSRVRIPFLGDRSFSKDRGKLKIVGNEVNIIAGTMY